MQGYQHEGHSLSLCENDQLMVGALLRYQAQTGADKGLLVTQEWLIKPCNYWVLRCLGAVGGVLATHRL